MTRVLAAAIALALLAPCASAQREVQMEIRSGEVFLMPILVEPVGIDGAIPRDLLDKLEGTLRNDLEYTDLFYIFIGTRESGRSPLTAQMDEQFRDQDPEAIVQATLHEKDGRVVLEGRLEDYGKAKEIFSESYPVEGKMPTWAVHAFVDDVTRHLTGETGIAQTRIAFVARPHGDRDADVNVIDWDGGRSSRVTELSSIVVSPAWSPEGRRIAFTSYHTGVPTLVAVDLKEANLWTIAREEGLNTAPAWSPRGDRIVMTLSRDGNAELYTTLSTGQDFRRITFSPGIDTSPSFAPTGRHIVFTSDRSGTPQLYIMDQDGSNTRRLTFWGRWNDSADWSPSGERIVYAGYTKSTFDLFLIQPDGGGLRRLTQNPGDCENPKWAPDSRHVVYSRRTDNERRLYVLDVETLRERPLTPSGTAAYNPAWSPTLSAKSETARWSQ